MFLTPEQKPIVKRTINDQPKALMRKNARETKKLVTKIAKIEEKKTLWRLNHETEVREMKKKLFSSQAHAKNSTGEKASLRKVKQLGNERTKEKHTTLNNNADEKENKQSTQIKETAKGKSIGDHQAKREKLFSQPKKLPDLEPISKQKNGIALALEKTSKLVALPIISESLLNESKSLSQMRTSPDVFIETIVSNSSESKSNNYRQRNTIEPYLKNDGSPTFKSSSGTKTFSPKLTKKESRNQRKKYVNPLKNIFQRPKAENKFLKFSEIKKTATSESKTNSEAEQPELNEPLPELNIGNISKTRNSPTKNEVPTNEVTSSNLLECIEDYGDSKIIETHSKNNAISVDNPQFIENVSKLGSSLKINLSSLRREFCVSPNNATFFIEDKAKHSELISNAVCSYKEKVEGCLMNSTDSARIATYVVEDSCEVPRYKSTSPFPIQSYDDGRKLNANINMVHEENGWPRRKSLFQEDAFEEIPKVDEENIPPLSSGRYGNFKWRDALHRISFKTHLTPAALIGKQSVEDIEELDDDTICQQN